MEFVENQPFTLRLSFLEVEDVNNPARHCYRTWLRSQRPSIRRLYCLFRSFTFYAESADYAVTFFFQSTLRRQSIYLVFGLRSLSYKDKIVFDYLNVNPRVPPVRA